MQKKEFNMNREGEISKLDDHFDVIVIGGGASGLGSALEATNRGYKVLLIEKYDFSKGTSSRSTKLIHGGVRYLEQGKFKLVKEALRERTYLLNQFPEIVQPINLVIPVYHWFQSFYYYVGLKLYDFLAGKSRLGRTHFLKSNQISDKLDLEHLNSAISFYDGLFDDSLMAIHLAKLIQKNGGTVLNYMSFEAFIFEKSRVIGVKIKDNITKNIYNINCDKIINATGIFSDEIVQKLNQNIPKRLSLSQGVHLVFDNAIFPEKYGIMIPKTSDGRVLFAIPWHSKIIVGTTDTGIPEPSIEPAAFDEEVLFIINSLNQYFQKSVKAEDIKSIFVGIRPLISPEKKNKATSHISREHQIHVANDNIFSVIGGKWTTFRKIGNDVNNFVFKDKRKLNDKSYEKIATVKFDYAHFFELSFEDKKAYLDPFLSDAIQYEWVTCIEDFLARRVRILFLDVALALALAPHVASKISEQSKNFYDPNKDIIDFKLIAGNYIYKTNKPSQ